ncbi:MAG: DNA polymerase III subunit delta' [Desulfatiglandales bacterium]
MGFEVVLGQSRVVKYLKRAIQKNRIAHAYLFVGPEGVGKTLVAKLLAAQVMGQDCNGCLVCGRCKSILWGNHPDLLTVTPLNKEVTIEQIRSLREEILNPPFEAPTRFILMQYAHKMTLEASNAFLKVLEEPNKGNVFILESPDEGLLLPTIVSRCVKLPFGPISKEEVAVFLREKYDLVPDEAQALAAISNGSIKKAIQFMEKGLLKRRAEIFYDHTEAIKRTLGEGPSSPHDTIIPKDVDPSDYLFLLLTWYRDLIASAVGVKSQFFFHQDFSTKLKELSKGSHLHSLLSIPLEIERARQDMGKEANFGLLMGELFLAFKDGLGI